jgi:hypothetical protein
LAGADASAFWIVVAVTDPPKRVLQAAVVQSGQDELGIPPTTPAVLQSVARFGAIIPDQENVPGGGGGGGGVIALTVMVAD